MHKHLRNKKIECGFHSIFLGLKSLENQGITAAYLMNTYPDQISRLSDELMTSPELTHPPEKHEDPLRVAAEYMLEEMLLMPYEPIKHGIPVTLPARYFLGLVRDEGHDVWQWHESESESEDEFPDTPILNAIGHHDELYKLSMFMDMTEPHPRVVSISPEELRRLIFTAPERVKHVSPHCIPDDMWIDVITIDPSMIEHIPEHLNLIDHLIHLSKIKHDGINEINGKWLWVKMQEDPDLRHAVFDIVRQNKIRNPYFYGGLDDQQFIESIIERPRMIYLSKLFEERGWDVLEEIFNSLACNSKWMNLMIAHLPAEYIGHKFLSGDLSFRLHEDSVKKRLEPSLITILEEMKDSCCDKLITSRPVRSFISDIELYTKIKPYLNEILLSGITPENLIHQYPNELRRIKLEMDMGVIECEHKSKEGEHPLLVAAEYIMQAVFVPPLSLDRYGIPIKPPAEYMAFRLNDISISHDPKYNEEKAYILQYLNSSQENIRIALLERNAVGVEQLSKFDVIDLLRISRFNPAGLSRLDPTMISDDQWPLLIDRDMRLLKYVPSHISKSELFVNHCISRGPDLSIFAWEEEDMINDLLKNSSERIANYLIAHDLGKHFSRHLNDRQFVEMILVEGGVYNVEDIGERPYEVIKEVTNHAMRYQHDIDHMMKQLPQRVVEQLLVDRVVKEDHIPSEILAKISKPSTPSKLSADSDSMTL